MKTDRRSLELEFKNFLANVPTCHRETITLITNLIEDEKKKINLKSITETEKTKIEQIVKDYERKISSIQYQRRKKAADNSPHCPSDRCTVLFWVFQVVSDCRGMSRRKFCELFSTSASTFKNRQKAPSNEQLNASQVEVKTKVKAILWGIE